MKQNTWVFIATMSFMLASASRAADIGTAFTYQGSLEKPAGTPVTGICDFRFGLWDAAAGGNPKGTSPQTVPGVSVNASVFTVPLDFGAGALDGTARWLEIEVRCPAGVGSFDLLTPRVELKPAPYALSVPGLRTDQTGGSPNILGGFTGNSALPGIVGATVSGGGGAFTSTDGRCVGSGSLCDENADCITGQPICVPDTSVGRCDDNAALCDSTHPCGTGNCVLPPAPNQALADYVSIGGGYGNVAGGEPALSRSAVPGTGPYSTIGGGVGNTASGPWSTVGGGGGNEASGSSSTIAGGGSNQTTGDHGAIGGGAGNIASVYATVGGGFTNSAAGSQATIGGGANNSASYYGTVGGGWYNDAQAAYVTIAGGGPTDPINPTTTNNVVYDNYGTIGGGGGNRAGSNDGILTNASYTTVGGGTANESRGLAATVAGGQENVAGNVGGPFPDSFAWGTVGGGRLNKATGQYSTVPGGVQNEARANNSFAAGSLAIVRVQDTGTFVWADADPPGGAFFTSTGPNQFLIDASGGVGIGTNAPQQSLSVYEGLNIDQADLNNGGNLTAPALFFGNASGEGIGSKRTVGGNRFGLDFYTAFQNRMAITQGGNVGIGLTNPTNQLQLSLNSAAKPTSNTWTISSDRRLKKNIQTLRGSLEKLLSLRGVSYEWIDPSTQGNMTSAYSGMIAQDVEKVFPEWIGTGSDGYKTLTVIGFEGLAVEALRDLRQEKDAQIDALQARVTALEHAFPANAQPEHPVSLTSIGVFAVPSLVLLGFVGLVALRRRNVNGGGQ